MSDWKYYNHAMIPNHEPHEEFKVNKISFNKNSILARWTTDWDCGYETDWWYVVKDEPFDINKLKSKRRYEINKGLKNFEVKVIDPLKYIKELYNVQIEATTDYPHKYKYNIEYSEFENQVNKWDRYRIFGAFKENILYGYALIKEGDKCIDFFALKTIPLCEKDGINFAIVYEILNYYESYLQSGSYINDGTRNVVHETKFQDFLEKYFEFRKVFCILWIKYKWFIKPFILILYPFRNLMMKSNNQVIYKLYSILKMEEFSRKCKKGLKDKCKI